MIPFSRRAALVALVSGPAASRWARAQATGVPELQGHRGTRGLAPENTLAAFRRALALGVDVLELDTGITADGQVVVMHDPRLNPNLTRDGAGQWLAGPGPLLRELTLAQLQAYDVGRLKPGTRYAQTYPEQQGADGVRVPTLAAVFDLVRSSRADRVRFNIETKLSPLEPDATLAPEPFAQAVLGVIQAHGMAKRCTLQSFDWRTLRVAQRLAPDLPTVALTARQSWLDNVADTRWTAGLALADHGGSLPALVRAAGARVWSPFFGDLTPALRDEARRLGLPVVVWTVNAPADIERMLDWQVDGLITDYPDRARAAMQRRGWALPAAVEPQS
ncbi:MAG: glycerophosphodiester phosphodiesterase [Aquabacterium sp.]